MVTATFWIPKTPVKKVLMKFCESSPDIVFGAAHAVVGLALISYALIKTGCNTEAFTKKYRIYNIVVRPDDPRAQQIKLVSGLDVKK